MAFNIIARNQDDHVKNIAFLMDKSGRWSLAPAFDVTYSLQSNRHLDSDAPDDDERQAGWIHAGGFSRLCQKRLDETRSCRDHCGGSFRCCVKWSDFAEQAQVVNNWREQIQQNLGLDLPSI